MFRRCRRFFPLLLPMFCTFIQLNALYRTLKTFSHVLIFVTYMLRIIFQVFSIPKKASKMSSVARSKRQSIDSPIDWIEWLLEPKCRATEVEQKYSFNYRRRWLCTRAVRLNNLFIYFLCLSTKLSNESGCIFCIQLNMRKKERWTYHYVETLL